MTKVVADKVAIQAARHAKCLSRVQVAAQAGVSFETIKAVERGRRQPTLNLAVKLSRVLDKSVEDLVRVEA